MGTSLSHQSYKFEISSSFDPVYLELMKIAILGMVRDFLHPRYDTNINVGNNYELKDVLSLILFQILPGCIIADAQWSNSCHWCQVEDIR